MSGSLIGAIIGIVIVVLLVTIGSSVDRERSSLAIGPVLSSYRA